MTEKWREEIEMAIAAFLSAAGLGGYPMNESMLDVEFLPAPHKPSSLPKNKMAVYGFWGDGEWLKIGKARPNSNARYLSQHYNPKSAQSTLAASLARDLNMLRISNFDPQQPGQWIKSSTNRINILLSADEPRELLSFLEAFLHLRLRPRYEH